MPVADRLDHSQVEQDHLAESCYSRANPVRRSSFRFDNFVRFVLCGLGDGGAVKRLDEIRVVYRYAADGCS
jgi:hypothetical protein